MGRLILVVILMIVSGIIYLVKAGVSKVSGKTEVNFQEESQKVMESTAKGVNWMNQQWDKAKAKAENNNLSLPSGSSKNGNADETATSIIAKIKSDPSYDQATAESAYIEHAVSKMDNRQFDDAEKLVMQLSEGEAREYMLNEIDEKRNQ